MYLPQLFILTGHTKEDFTHIALFFFLQYTAFQVNLYSHRGNTPLEMSVSLQ